MIPIIIAFPKPEQAKSIKCILARGGFPVAAVCTSGAHVLQAAHELGDGIVVCGSRLADMVYHQLYADLPPHFQMLLLASPAVCSQSPGEIRGLSMPLKAQELLETVGQMEEQIVRQKKARRRKPPVRTQEEQRLIDEAKARLMEQKHLPEEEAHRYLQKISMDSGRSLFETAQMVLELELER